MLKARRPPEKANLRLIKGKPEPDILPGDREFLDSVLEKGFTYTRYLSIDSVGAERMSEKKKFSVILHCKKTELHLFIRSELGGTPFSEAGNERLASILWRAESDGLIRLREMR